MIEGRLSTCCILFCAGLSIAGCAGCHQAAPQESFTALDESRILAALMKEAEDQFPHDSPAYLNLLASDSVSRMGAHPDLFLDAWRHDLLGELKANPRDLSKYAEALLVVPRAFSDADLGRQARQEYVQTLHQVWSDKRLGPRGNKVAMLTLIQLGDQEAIKASIALYRMANTEERSDEYLRAYNHVSDMALEVHGDPIWRLANEVLSACSKMPPTPEQLEWCQWLRRHPHRACLGPVARIFQMLESLSPTKQQMETWRGEYIGWVWVVPEALAAISGSEAIPLLRRNFGNPWSEFAETCRECALSVGDPEALKYLISTITPASIHAATKPDSFTADVERLFEVLKLLEPGTLPELDEALVLSGAEPIPEDFEKAWVRLYRAVRENRVDLIAKPGLREVVFQVIYKY
jgi:hypothetical protein